MNQVIPLRTGHVRRVSEHEVEVALVVARQIVEDTAHLSELDDRTRLSIALVAMTQQRDELREKLLAAKLRGYL